MSYKIGFDPTYDKWVLSDDKHYFEVPYWIWEIIANELERETRQLKIDNAKLREQCADLYAEMITYSNAPNYNASVWAPKLRELGMEVDAYDRDR